MGAPLRIDFVSDVACPWCVVGLRSLLKAIDAVGDKVDVQIHFQPFELNPDMAAEGENTTEHVQKKYGSTPERSAAARQALKDSGAALGFDFNYSPQSRIWNTFDAHRLLHWAGIEGKQLELKEALFRVNFTEQQSTSDHEVLAKAAESAGLDGKRAREILKSGEFTKEVRSEEMVWRNRGISAVPSVIFNQRWMIQGGQPPQVFEQAIRQIVEGTAQEERA
ncbi:MAG TPA: DsbA family oxidoreductase [Hyphomonadaceae bacterium]|jgi:predicted DsbA family dithiol-disulfide isomerase|nr:DsbA family oxidoreductase [Hyphomonadaceae bacterium]